MEDDSAEAGTRSPGGSGAGSRGADLEAGGRADAPSAGAAAGRELIHRNDVVKALRSFVEETKQQNPKYVSTLHAREPQEHTHTHAHTRTHTHTHARVSHIL